MFYRAASDKPISRAPGLRRVRHNDSQVPSSAGTVSDATNLFPRVTREHGQSRVTIDLDISGHKPLTVGAVQQFVSECNSKFNGDNGENFATNTRQGQAVMAFLNSLYTGDNRWKTNMEDFLQNHRTMQVDPRMSALPVLYVRERLWDGMTDAIFDFFHGRGCIPRHTPDEMALTKALVAYADSVGDTAAQKKIQLFANGMDDALDQFYDTKFGPSQR